MKKRQSLLSETYCLYWLSLKKASKHCSAFTILVSLHWLFKQNFQPNHFTYFNVKRETWKKDEESWNTELSLCGSSLSQTIDPKYPIPGTQNINTSQNIQLQDLTKHQFLLYSSPIIIFQFQYLTHSLTIHTNVVKTWLICKGK